ncbi:hypothetical protein ABZ770_33565 [Streptomyces sp. NPDC006654]|uniref:hypothetical protein n=1 Tax=Streptomyces sp. NPDC006654 TaxID=3156897 RepID=UPI0033C7DDE7
MRAIRVASAALLGVGALALSAPAILANDGGGGEEGRDGGRDSAPFGFRVTPSTVAAGGRVSFHLNRGDGCRGTATVASSLFDTIRIPAGQDSGTATVGRDVRSQGSYRVTFDCDGISGSTELAVSEGGRTAGDTGGRTDGDSHSDGSGSGSGSGSGDSHSDGAGDGARDQELNPQPLPPSRGVRAGEGGSFDGFDLKEIGLGTALVLGTVGTAYRRARGRTGEDGA